MKRLILAALFSLAAIAQNLPNATPMPSAVYQFTDQNGVPLAGGFLYTCAAGLSCPGNPQASYTDSTASVQNSNPIVLDSAGRAQIWLGPQAYRLVLEDANMVQQWTQDNVSDTALYFVNYVRTVGTATLISYTNPISGAVQRTVSNRLSDRTSVGDFGAACDGATDDNAAIQAAINDTAAAAVTLSFPSGVCLATALTLPSGANLQGQGIGLTTLRQKAGSAVPGTPFIKNANQTGGNTNLSLGALTIDGNAANQSLTRAGALNQEIPALSLIQVTDVAISRVGFVNCAGACVYGFAWTRFSMKDSTASNYANFSSTFPNTGCVQLDYNGTTGPSTDLNLVNNFCDGSGTHVGGFKLAGTPTNPISNINIAGNSIITGDANGSMGLITLAIELYTPTSQGFSKFNIVDNLIRGESASSPTSTTTGGTWGISVAGAGGSTGTITGNTIRWIGAISIEVVNCNHVTVSSNTIDTSNVIFVAAAQSGGASENIELIGNVINNPLDVFGNNAPIKLYSESGNVLSAVSVVGNKIFYASATTTRSIYVQSNNGSTIKNVLVSSNTIWGPGSGSSTYGVVLEADVAATLTQTLVTANHLDNLLAAVQFGGDDHTIVTGNIYGSSLGAVYNGPVPATDAIFDLTPGAPSSATTNVNLLMNGHTGQYLQIAEALDSPNVISYNSTNGTPTTAGGFISVNSRFTGQPNWIQTSTNAYTRALFMRLAAAKFSIGYGPATNANGTEPADNQVLIVDETGVAIGQAAGATGSRITSAQSASATWDPGTIAAGAAAQTNLGVSTCAAGAIALADLSTVTTQNATLTANSDAGLVRVVLRNNTGGNLTPGSGTLKVFCIGTTP